MLDQLSVRPLGSGVRNAPDDVAAAIARVVHLWDEIAASLQRTLADERFSAETRAAIAEAVESYLDQGRAMLAELESERGVPRRRELEDVFIRRYAIDCWDVLSVKDPVSVPPPPAAMAASINSSGCRARL